MYTPWVIPISTSPSQRPWSLRRGEFVAMGRRRAGDEEHVVTKVIWSHIYTFLPASTIHLRMSYPTTTPRHQSWKILPIPIYARFRNGYNKCSMIFHSSKPTSRKRSSITSNGESSGRSSRSSRQSKSATHEHHTASTKLRGTNSPCYGLSIVSIWALDFLPSHSS